VSSSTAILFFSRTPAAESRAKRWLPGKARRNRRLSEWLIAHSREQARLSGLPVVWISEREQRGDDFGARFSDAIGQVFAQGYEAVICIGNDSPGLRPAHLQEAARQLQAQPLVLGPATDGGVYLLGLRR
jgi:hypothetical protein